MRTDRWLQRQSRRRLAFIVCGVFSVMLAAVQIGVSLGFAAYHPGRPFHAPPLWVFPLDALCSAAVAAVTTMRRSKQIR
jgi:hypothetical protein